MASHSSEALSAWLIAFLDAGIDAETGLRFLVGPGGELMTAPSLRVQVLAWLGDLDQEAATVVARTILVNSASPDEWALALRNYGRLLDAPAQDAFFLDRVTTLLANNDWQSAPTGGYLEAFDTAVHSRSASVVPELIALITERPHPATRKAAMMALDNLTGDDPLLVAELLTTNDSPMAQLPTFRASLLARLDPRDDAHVAELQHYLLDISHGVDELMTFANTFPNANDFAAHYLLTHQPGRNLYEVARVDLAAYGLVRQWQQDPAFASLYPSLQQVEQRLRPFLEDAVAGGFLQSTDVP